MDFLQLAVIAAVLLVNCVKSTFQVLYPAPWAPPLITNSVTYRSEDPVALQNMQIAQFHSQDAAGRYVFGFNTPDQARVEARSHDGKVRGSYSYIDPFGRMVKMEYWDDGHGFHMAEPKDSFPVYTPEVQAARELHFHLYNRALEAALAGGPPIVTAIRIDESSSGNKPNNNDDKNEKPQSGDANDENQDDSITVDKIPSSPSSPPTGFENLDFGQDDFNKQPDYSYLNDQSQDLYKQLEDQFDFSYTPNKEVYDPEKESVIVDSASPSRTFNNNAFINTERSGKSTDEIQLDTKLVPDATSLDSREDEKNIKVHVLPDHPNMETSVETSVSKDGFFYQFQHPVFQQESQEQSDLFKSQSSQESQFKQQTPESLHAALFGAIPIDAVHDTQVSPKQQDVIRNHQTLPIFLNLGKS